MLQDRYIFTLQVLKKRSEQVINQWLAGPKKIPLQASIHTGEQEGWS